MDISEDIAGNSKVFLESNQEDLRMTVIQGSKSKHAFNDEVL